MIEVTVLPKINRTPAMKLLAKGWHELLEHGFTDSIVMLGWDDQGIMATLDGTPIGVIAFSESTGDDTLWIKIGYVVPTYRRCGVYRQMWDALVKLARERKLKEIQGATDPRNERMIRVNERLGRSVRALFYKYEL